MNIPIPFNQNGYICLYNKAKIEVYAKTTYEAQCTAARLLKVPEKKRYMISVYLCEKQGEPVIHSTSEV
jgi:hypothetical protein